MADPSQIFLGLSKIHKVFRIFLVLSGFSFYFLLVYKVDPSFFESTFLTYFILPFVASIGFMMLVPQLASQSNGDKEYSKEKSKKSKNAKKTREEGQSTQSNLQQPSAVDNITENSENSSVGKDAIQKYETVEDGNFGPLDINTIDKTIEHKIEPLHTEYDSIKEQINDLKSEIEEVRSNFDDLKKKKEEENETYETTLTELKAFQAEIDNPFNFISKYFEMLDIPSLTDTQVSNKKLLNHANALKDNDKSTAESKLKTSHTQENTDNNSKKYSTELQDAIPGSEPLKNQKQKFSEGISAIESNKKDSLSSNSSNAEGNVNIDSAESGPFWQNHPKTHQQSSRQQENDYSSSGTKHNASENPHSNSEEPTKEDETSNSADNSIHRPKGVRVVG